MNIGIEPAARFKTKLKTSRHFDDIIVSDVLKSVDMSSTMNSVIAAEWDNFFEYLRKNHISSNDN